MPEINSIVDVNVTLATRPTATANFSLPLFLTTNNVFTERARAYTSVSTAQADGFDTQHPVIKYLNGIFSGNFPPRKVWVGRKLLGSIDIVPTTVTDDTIYSYKILVDTTETVISIDSGTSATATTIATALVAAMSGVAGVTLTDNTGSLNIVANDMSLVFTLFDVTANLGAIYNTDVTESWTTCYNDTRQFLPEDYFFLGCDSHTVADQTELFGLAQANDDFYVTSSQASGVIDPVDDTDIMSEMQTLSYQKGMIMYHSAADTYYPEGAIVGAWAGTDEGTTTLHGRTLVGVPTDDLTETEISTIQSKSGSSYPEIAGAGFMLDGFVPDGNFADTIRFALWLESRVAESVFGLIKSKSDTGKKVPFNNIGIAMVRQAIANPLDIAFSRGATTKDESTGEAYTIITPTRLEVPVNDRANRYLPDIQFYVIYSGAVHRCKINGTVSI